jgi:hypothetical protein
MWTHVGSCNPSQALPVTLRDTPSTHLLFFAANIESQ